MDTCSSSPAGTGERGLIMAKCKYKESCGYEFCLDDCCPEFEAAVETNADRIRSMTDEELADFIEKVASLGTEYDSCCQNKKECGEMLDRDEQIPDAWCRQCRVAWLQQPVGEATP